MKTIHSWMVEGDNRNGERQMIKNMRLGFANNSSSSHSVLVGVGRDYRDYGNVGCNGPWAFGWEFGTVADEKSKRQYLASTVFNNFSGGNQKRNDPMTALAIAAAKSIDSEFPDDPDYNCYVDHQSLMSLPWSWDEEGPNGEFIDDLKNFLLRPDVVVTLGNDNEYRDNGPVEGDGKKWSGLPTDNPMSAVARKEADWIWTLFSRSHGNRFTVSFKDGAELPARLSAPHLMDVKITDYCPFKCDFCYQGSTSSGSNASFEQISRLAIEARDARVFEVAIGGGEPTMHPSFIETLRCFRDCGVVPNFTTYTLEWMDDRETRTRILDLCGSFAYSAMNYGRIRLLATTLDKYGIDRDRVAVHIIMGVRPLDKTIDLMKRCRDEEINAVTLLGYKSTGRGGPCRHEYGDWLRRLLDLSWGERPYRIAIDTVLAAQSRGALDEIEMPHWLYHTSEGSSSMYVDLVTRKAGPSSYHPDHMIEHVSLADSWAKIHSVEGDAE